jgi:hypothetical protein
MKREAKILICLFFGQNLDGVFAIIARGCLPHPALSKGEGSKKEGSKRAKLKSSPLERI